MDRNHGVLIAVMAGVAIAGTSYAASAVLFGNDGGNESASVQQAEVVSSKPAVKASVGQAEESAVLGAETPGLSRGKDSANGPSTVIPDTVLPKTSEPARSLTPVYANSQENLALAQAILKELPGYPCAEANPDDAETVRYFYTFADLNEDGNDEAIAYLVGSYTCGTGGCTAMIFDVNDGEYTLNSRMTLVRTPIVVADQKTNGWHDLVIPVSGGGATPSDHVLQWAGNAYPSNPSTAPEWTESTLDGVALIADDITAETPAPQLAGDVCLP